MEATIKTKDEELQNGKTDAELKQAEGEELMANIVNLEAHIQSRDEELQIKKTDLEALQA